MKITTKQNRIIHMLLPAVIKNDADQKATLVQQFTNDWNRTSMSDLTFIEANQIIVRFGGTPLKYEHWGVFDYKKTSHRMILSLLRQLGWQTFNEKRRGMVADMYRFSEWLKSEKAPIQKPLQLMTKIEVSKIITALESMVVKQHQNV